MAVALSAEPAGAAPITYDCQARLTRVPVVPPVRAGESDPWQCPVPSTKPDMGTHWQRNSLEYCRLAVGAYEDALEAALRMSRRHARGEWIVILDADETVIDNSLFERERQACGSVFKDEQWESWVAADLAPDVPGAASFTNAVHRLGGMIAIVTNRAAKDDAITQGTLKKAGIWFDYEIGMADVADKTERWRGVKGALAAKFGGHPRAVMWIGDQVTDLAVLDKAGRITRAMTQGDNGAGIGDYLFLLPNPMYGNWQKNPND
ncbi:MAG TPA: HAD family acid phosphatase [Rhizomicrobium sp.]